jgi:hypothetical protein
MPYGISLDTAVNFIDVIFTGPKVHKILFKDCSSLNVGYTDIHYKVSRSGRHVSAPNVDTFNKDFFVSHISHS